MVIHTIKRTALVLSVLFLSSFVFLKADVQAEGEDSSGFGISPSELQYTKFLKGAEYEQTFTISRAEYDKDVNAEVELVVVSDNVADWITIEPSAEFTLPAGQQQADFRTRVTVPADAELGDYEAELVVRLVPGSEEGVAVVPGISITLDFSVVDEEVKEWEVRKVAIEDFNSGEPLVLTVTLNNMGNVPAKPTKATVEVYGMDDELVQSLESTESTEAAGYTLSDIQMTFSDADLPQGEYYAAIAIYDNETEKYTEEKVVFNVGPEVPGTVSEETTAETDSNNYLMLGGIVVALLAIIIVIYLVLSMSKEKSSLDTDKKEEKNNDTEGEVS